MAVPEPMLDSSPVRIDVLGHAVSVLLTMDSQPRITLFGDLFSREECSALIKLATSRMKRSQVVDRATPGATKLDPIRTSSHMFFRLGENPLVTRLEGRIAQLLNWPVEFGEGLQVLRYEEGQEYKPHLDCFEEGTSSGQSHIGTSENRVATLITYLSEPLEGGYTIFPNAGVRVSPVQGNAVLFSYPTASYASKSQHGGCPVISGEKWIATKWFRGASYRGGSG